MGTVTSMTSDAINALFDAVNAVLAGKADLSSGVVPDTELPTNLVRHDDLVINVQDHGAVGDGVTDDTTTLTTVVNAAPAGSTVYFPKSYATTAPIKIPPQVRILGAHGAHIDTIVKPTFKPKSTFVGASVLLLVDQATGGYATVSNEQRIENLTIDCSNIVGGSVDGIQAQGYVHGVYIKDVGVQHPPGHGFTYSSNASGVPYSWRVVRLHVTSPGGIGITTTMTDATFEDCQVINGGSHGFALGTDANTKLIACRAEWCAADGYNFTTGTGTTGASGGPLLLGCSTDRNAHNGISIPSAATGNGIISIIGGKFRRDGSASSSSGYAAINVNGATSPVIISGCEVFPGTNDDGTGTASPQYGISATSANVQINGGFYHAITEGVHDGGSNTRLARSINVFERTGTASAPVTVTRGIQANGTNSESLDVPGNLAGLPGPRSNNAIAWTSDPTAVGGGALVTNGVVYLSALYVPKSTTAVKLWWCTTTAGATPTAGQNFVGLYDASGNRLVTVGIDGRVTVANTLFGETISVPVVAGVYYVAWVFNAATAPNVAHASSINATLLNFNLTVSTARYATNGTGQTSLPATLTMASNANSTQSYWAAIS